MDARLKDKAAANVLVAWMRRSSTVVVNDSRVSCTHRKAIARHGRG